MSSEGSWKKSDPALVDRFHAALPDHPAAERRKMFGYPACFVNGNYFSGLYQDEVVVRLPGEMRDRFTELSDAQPFDPMGTGKGMKDWYRVPTEIADDDERLAAFLQAAIVEVAELPPKERKKRR